MEKDISIKVRALNEQCSLCHKLSPILLGYGEVYANDKVIEKTLKFECEHLETCKRAVQTYLLLL